MRAAALLILVWGLMAEAANQSPGSGGYAGTLGAGAATGAERTGFGGNPAALSGGGAGLRFDSHRPFGLEDLRVAEAGLFADAARFGGALDWRTTGIDGVWREQGFRVALAGGPLRAAGFPGSLDAGAEWTAWRQEWPGRGAEWSGAAAAGLIWAPWPRIRAGAFLGDALGGSGEGARIVHFGFGAIAPAQTLRFDFRRTGAAPWRALASLSVRPHPACEFSGGLASPPFQASAGCALAWRGFRVRQAIRYHRYLGRTWLSGADWLSGSGRNGRPRAAQPGLGP